MRELLTESVLSRKSEMYAMVTAIEADFISNIFKKLDFVDIPQRIVDRANRVIEETNPLLSILRGLDIQAYIEICNMNVVKLNINADHKSFINSELAKIIPIRNAVMHPRPLGFFDYPMLKAIFEDIPQRISCFAWDLVNMTRTQIKEHPETLLPPPESLKKSNSIIENLPSFVDYEETSFIGRRREIGEIKAQLNRKNVNILSIIGDGGVGKTATTLKLLYDMLDDPNCQYELIIWTSLKTNELSDHDFLEICDSIRSTAQMYEKLAPYVGTSMAEDTKSFIIELAQSFRTLFVLDNLETINTSDIKGFFDEFSEYGQVLITSRIGLGEMEHRYKLSGFEDNDVLQYTDILLNLYGFGCLYTDERKKQIACEELHSNPLAIKWFIRCLYNGQTEEEILAHKEDVINFCMANVYDKLTEDAHSVLDILTVAGVELSFPELMYYMECSLLDCVRIRYSINELGKCNFINEEKFRRDKNIAVTEFAHEFLLLHYSGIKHLLARFKELEQKLIALGQQLLIRKTEDPYDVRSIQYKSKSELVAAYFLKRALTFPKTPDQEEVAFEMVKFAQELLPKYYESNLVLAHIYGTTSPIKARSEYLNAIKYCISTEEKVRVHILFADFLIRLNDYPGAIETLSQVEKLSPECAEIHFEKAKALSCIGQFPEATAELDLLEGYCSTNTQRNKIIAKRADILMRQSNRIDIRETQRRLKYLTQAFEILESADSREKIVVDYMVVILINILYLHMDNDALDYVLDKIKMHYIELRKSSKYHEFRKFVTDKEAQINNTNFLKKISVFIISYNEYLDLLGINEAFVYTLKQGYGFCRNNEYPNGIYFSMVGLPTNLSYGDIIQYSSLFISKNGPQALGARKIGNIDTRITETFNEYTSSKDA